MKNTIFKTMVALLLTLAATACTDDMPVTGNPQGGDNQHPDATRITTLKNILPTSKPGYQGVDGRAYNNATDEWRENDELLLKVEIKDSENTAYTAWMTLQYNGTNWSIKSTTTGTEDATTTTYAYFAQKANDEIKSFSELPLVTPAEYIVLTGEEANFDAIIPEELENAELNVELMYAPDLEWAETTAEQGDAATTTCIALSLKDNAFTTTPEVWEVKAKSESESSVVVGGKEATDETVWDTNLARICVETGTAGDVVTLTSSDFVPYEGCKADNGIYTATSTGTDGIAYFFGTIGTNIPVTDGFKISLDKVKLSLDEEAEQVFIPTTLFEASALTSVSLNPAKSYKLEGIAARTQAENDSKPAEIITDDDEKKTYVVYGVRGLLEWAAALNISDGEVKFSLDLQEDITLPQYEIKSSGTSDNLSYSYKENPISYDENGNPTNSNWLKINSGTNEENKIIGFSGTVDGCGHTISGLRLNDTAFMVLVDNDGIIKKLNFADAIVASVQSSAVIVVSNKGNLEECKVIDSKVSGIGNVGALVATNRGTVSNCHNFHTDVICENTVAGENTESELVGGVVGYNVGPGFKNEEKTGKVENCTNSGRVISHGSRKHNFTGGIVGHSYGIVSSCTNTGYVEGSTNGLSSDVSCYTSVGGVVGNCSFGRVIASINEGSVKSVTQKGESPKTLNNRVGGVIGYAGTNSAVVACANIGQVEGNQADVNYVGGIVGQLLHSYEKEVTNGTPGKVYGSWTKEVDEKTLASGEGKDGIGFLPTSSKGLVNTTCVFKDRSVIVYNNITEMNIAISTYNNGNPENQCNYTWSWISGSWPTLKQEQELTLNL